MSDSTDLLASWQQLVDLGYERELLPIIPPGAPLHPSSKIKPAMLGKVPGELTAGGSWVGLRGPWWKLQPKEGSWRKWASWGAQPGLQARFLPAVDVDTEHRGIHDMVREAAMATLGQGVPRIRKGSERLLLMYAAADPFRKHRSWFGFDQGRSRHLVEVLAQGQQFVVGGRHPSGDEYSLYPIHRDEVPDVTEAEVEQFLALLGELVESAGGEVLKRGVQQAAAGEAMTIGDLQHVLEVEVVAGALQGLPNVGFDRDRWVGVCAAVALATAHSGEGRDLWLEWCARREDGPVDQDEDARVWDQLGDHAYRDLGAFVDLGRPEDDFDPDPDPPPGAVEPVAEMDTSSTTDDVLADVVVEQHGRDMRYVAEAASWASWEGHRWVMRGTTTAECQERVSGLLRRLSAGMPRREAQSLQAVKKRDSVMRVLQARMATSIELFDDGHGLLNTPGGMVSLASGQVHPPSPAALVMHAAVAEPGGEAPTWHAFLDEATGGDQELQRYLQLLVGYAITGCYDEHLMFLIWGPGGNGKGVFSDVLTRVLNDYVAVTDPGVFMRRAATGVNVAASLAKLKGKRLVICPEVPAGDLAVERVKQWSAGDIIEAKALYGQPFTFRAQGVLMMLGQGRPAVKQVDTAIERRMRMVPFVVKPREVNPALVLDIVAAEAAGVVRWAVDGAREYLGMREAGLTLAGMWPAAVRRETMRYFAENDLLREFVTDQCRLERAAVTPVQDIREAFNTWVKARGDFGAEYAEKSPFKRELLSRFSELGDAGRQRVGGRSEDQKVSCVQGLALGRLKAVG